MVFGRNLLPLPGSLVSTLSNTLESAGGTPEFVRYNKSISVGELMFTFTAVFSVIFMLKSVTEAGSAWYKRYNIDAKR